MKQKQAVRRRTREVVGMVQAKDFDWRPEKDALSLGEMLRHLWVSEEGVRRAALDGDFSYFETRIPHGLRAALGAPTTLAEELAQLDNVHQETLRLVSALPAERFDEERVHEALDFRRKVYAMLLGINEHEIHHRAQLMTYLRMLGTPVPESINRR
ncbi:MAG TPA: DinB family protein [Candidatus Acidoferrales bacterium]|nr:DinB family protein [Candidatus Acidoferrales bacterium]